MEFYILEGKEIKTTNDVIAYSNAFRNRNHVVKKTMVAPEVLVSTVFVGIDHQFGEGPLLIFETMIFGGEQDCETYRYSTWDEAVRGHDFVVGTFTEKCTYCSTLRKHIRTKCENCGAPFKGFNREV